MDLVVKPTSVCNFACTFCSSTKIADKEGSAEVSVDQIKRFLKRYPKTTSIIMNGGDPLMMDPEYYWEILKYIEEHNLPTELGMTTNLWDFYLHPEKWIDIFKHKNVCLCTSFNYGGTRRVSKDMEYTEELFLKVVDKYKEVIGEPPMFLAVVTEETEHLALDHLRLAKRLGTQCRLNPGVASGRLGKTFPLNKMYKIYIDAINENLHEYERNIWEIISLCFNQGVGCPYSPMCHRGIRVLQPDGYYSCPTFADESKYPIDFEKEMAGETINPYLDEGSRLFAIKEECLTCIAFRHCNSCRKRIEDSAEQGLPEGYCSEMREHVTELNNRKEKIADCRVPTHNHEYFGLSMSMV